VFSDALPRLTYVDAQDRVQQLTPELRSALADLRNKVSEFTATSPDAPPRVAVYPLGGRVAVVNYTELPAACGLTGMAGMAHRLTKVYGLDGATLGSDGATLRLPPHAVLVVE
jgi:ubiquinone biosynthesis protein UbiJ